MPRRVVLALAGLVVSAAVLGLCAAPAQAAPRVVWSDYGQSAYRLGAGRVHHDVQGVDPIASMAKVMTAYLVLRHAPLRGTSPGFTIRVTKRDVADWRRRVSRDESTVAVRAGERLTERQALLALLLPSANNIAILLARKVSGSVGAFVRAMNRTARSLHMTRTTYTDPSGFDAHTVSTAVDQLTLAQTAMRLPTLRAMVARKRAWVPVAGTVRSTDTLLGTDGFVGIKTGSMDASGGCFMFLSHRLVRGRRVDLYGVVMGQPGPDLVAAGLNAAKRLADQAAPEAA